MSQIQQQSNAVANIHDQARRRAEELRQDAVDGMWHDLDHALASAADQSARAARRWAQRLRQHGLQREAASVASVES